MMIDLHSFASNSYDPREELRLPFIVDDWAVATDGKTLVAVPRESYNGELGKLKSEYMLEKIRAHLEVLGGSSELPGQEADLSMVPEIEFEECPHCECMTLEVDSHCDINGVRLWVNRLRKIMKLYGLRLFLDSENPLSLQYFKFNGGVGIFIPMKPGVPFNA